MSKVFLVDGSSVFFRSYHGIRDLRRSDGKAVNALYGYLLTIRSLLNEYKPEEMAVAFDLPDKTFRKEMYESYKANRAQPPDDLIAQIPWIKKATELLGITQFEAAGFEADDIIGTLAARFSQQGKESVIVSSDKDLLQLVNGGVSVLRQTLQGNQLYTAKEVEERFGVKPEQMIDYLALTGDSSDNVPGVPGIGEKTAKDLIQQFGSLDNLYKNLNQLKGKKRENLLNHKDMAMLSQKLVTIHVNVPIDMGTDGVKIGAPDWEGLRAFYLEMEFRTFASELGGAPAKAEELRYETIRSFAELKEMIAQIKRRGACALDTETTSLDSLSARLVGFSFSVEERQGWYVPIGHSRGENLPREEAYSLLKEIVESDSIRKTGHNLKYDYHVLENEGFQLSGVKDDTLIASHLVQPERTTHKLDDLAIGQLGMKMTPISDLIGSGKNQGCMADVDIEKVSPYACEDADAAWRLNQKLAPRIEELGLARLYRGVEIPLMTVLAAMERRGIKVDPAILQEQSCELGAEMDRLAAEIFQSVGREFNLNSPMQLAEILYDDLQLLSGRKRSTRADILEKLADEGVPIAVKILEYRHRQKIKSTYLDALQQLIRPTTGRVHTTYNQTSANTGRISSSDPNLQNIPIRTDVGRRVRRAFVAKAGCLLLSLDYSQIELRILAHVSKDPGLLAAFAAGEDIHRRTAAEIFGAPLEQVTPDMRRKAKEINFGLNYGMSSYGLAKRLNIPENEAAACIEKYFKRYPAVQRYMDEIIAFAQEKSYVLTVLGRRISTPGLRDSNRMHQENAKRAAINAPIQGSSADLLKAAMVNVHRALNPDEAAILLTVHDELILEVKEERAEAVNRLCRELMESALEISIPIPVECSIGSSWADLK
ncbi:MAG: DNA polymerase I [Candidatus Omnitrophota bacterium]